jgi:hypothetical protein
MGRVSRGSTEKVEVGILPPLEEQVSAAPLENGVPNLISSQIGSEQLATQVETMWIQMHYISLGKTI